MKRRQLFPVLAFGALSSTLPTIATDNSSHIEWVAEVLKQIESVKPGATRGALLKVFTTEGGLSNASERVFVSRDCPYFKVHVRFRAVGKPDGDGRVLTENLEDIVSAISSPYLQFTISD